MTKIKVVGLESLEQLQQFVKPAWRPSNFDKTRKVDLHQFGKPTWQNRNLAKLTSLRVYLRARIVVAIGVSLQVGG
jgi:hypothetical protein